MFFWGHTVSGEMAQPGSLGPLTDNASGLALALAPAGRQTPNQRWLMTYNLGYHDTDQLSSMIYGGLFIPLTVASVGGPLTFTHRWGFASGLGAAAATFAAQFDRPLWPGFKVDGDSRTLTLADKTTLTEKRLAQTADAYSYSGSGTPGVPDYEGSFSVSGDDAAELTWTVTFTPADPATAVRMFATLASAAAAMMGVLGKEFTPVSAEDG